MGGNGRESLTFKCPLRYKIGCEKSEFGEVPGAHTKRGCWAGRKGQWEHQSAAIRCMLGLILGGISSLLLLWLGRKKIYGFPTFNNYCLSLYQIQKLYGWGKKVCLQGSKAWPNHHFPLPRDLTGKRLPHSPPSLSFLLCSQTPQLLHHQELSGASHYASWMRVDMGKSFVSLEASKTLCYSKPAIIIHKCKVQKKSLKFPSHKNVLPVKAALNRQCIFSDSEAESSIR